jgi:L-threonylcarbamoyladenylate synthase
MDFLKDSKKALNKAKEEINQGRVVVFPTDTVYGFLADFGNKKAVEKVYKIKKRPKLKPLAVFVKDIKMAKELAEISKEQEKILKKYWPGKYTFVLSKKDGKGTIALRIPKYKLLNDLLKKINKPLAQTSVNVSGQPTLSNPGEIAKIFGKGRIKPDLIVYDKNLSRPARRSGRGSSTLSGPKRKPSAIIDLTNEKNKILRK